MTSRSLVAILCVAALSLTACGDSSDDDGPVGEVGAAATGAPFDPDQPLDEDQARAVLVTESELGSGFVETGSQKEDNSVLSCMAVVDDLDQFGPQPSTKVERSFSSQPNENQRLLSAVNSYDSESKAGEVFSALRDHVSDCGHLKDRQKTVRWEADTDVSDENEEGTDEKFVLVVDGTVRVKKDSAPFLGNYAVARVGNTIIMVALINTIDDDPKMLVDYLFGKSLERLVALRPSSG